MTATIRGVEYYYVTVKDQPGEAARFLTHLAEAKIHLLAFSAFPIGPGVVQFALFPESLEGLERTAAKHGFTVMGPQQAFLIQGEELPEGWHAVDKADGDRILGRCLGPGNKNSTTQHDDCEGGLCNKCGAGGGPGGGPPSGPVCSSRWA